MVEIPLKSQFVSLIVTLISGLAELFLFGALLGFNKYSECIALRKGRQVSVRLHRIRAKFLAVLAMVVFIFLEVIMSFFSDPAIEIKFRTDECLAVDRIDLREGFTGDTNDEDFILIRCIGIKKDGFLQRAGNFSLNPNTKARVRCGKHALYEYPNEDDLQFTLTNVTRTGGTDTDLVLECILPTPAVGEKPPTERLCAAVRQLPPNSIGFTNVYLSAAVRESEVGPLVNQQVVIPFLETSVRYNTSGLSRNFARRLLRAYDKDVTDPMEIRKRVFMGIERRKCAFEHRKKDLTTVPLGLVYGIVAAWILSFLTFASTLLLRRSIFYDMSDPLHWAQRTYRHIDEPIVGNPVVTSVYEHGERLMYVSGSASNDDDLLSRMRNIRITWPWRRRNRDNAPNVERQHSFVEQQANV
ncbi:hypothetical protein BWQ96_04957 [Gracilariopsis chorda]|uniref:Uncharacterized protein n=1 Tax=Gracilariopsis chorda TaxID=448386 RepID=A0A2V3IT05_9FLOR|nr:hypothetical protein BWQ96_04957 [Gracilariopsis chorda]|eukprot:PXF45258.1 hypothetical protein BWQ96_04957 [Gracilariopsis chorda]